MSTTAAELGLSAEEQLDVLEAFARPLGREVHVLSERPDLLWQQLVNRLQWDEHAARSVLHRERERRRAEMTATWFRLRTRYRESVGLLRVLAGHTGPVAACTFSRDGALLLSSSEDATLRVWETASRQELWTLKGHCDSVTACAFSPDGARIVSASADRTLKLWDSRSGEEVRTLEGHTSAVRACIFSSDGAQIVSASADGTLKLWDAVTGDERASLEGARPVPAYAVSPSTAYLVYATGDGMLKVLDLTTGAERATLAGHSGEEVKEGPLASPRYRETRPRVTSCAFGPDGSHIVSAGRDGTLKLWDVSSGAERATLEGHSESRSHAESRVGGRHGPAVIACAFSPIGTVLVSASEDETLKIWDVETGANLHTLRGHHGPCEAVAFSPDGTEIASISPGSATILGFHEAYDVQPGSLKVWDARTGVERVTLEGHAGLVHACAFSPDGGLLASAGHDRTLRVWDATATAEQNAVGGHADSVRVCIITPDGTTCLSAGDDCKVKIWETDGGVELATVGHGDWIWSCAISPDGRRAVSASADKTLFVIDLETQDLLTRLWGHGDVVWTTAFSPDGSQVVSASRDGTLKLWDAETYTERATLSPGDSMRVCAFSPDGSLLVSAGEEGTVRLWSVPRRRELRSLRGHTDSVRACAFSPDGSQVASASLDGTVKLWRAQTGAETTLEGHAGAIYSCAFSPDGTLLGSASADGTLRLWDVASGSERGTLAGHADTVWTCAFSPDGALVASASSDRTVRLWDVASGRQWGTLPCADAVRCLALDGRRPLAACGDWAGNVYIAELAGIKYSPIVVTAVDRGSGPIVRCPACFEQLPLEEGWLGQVVDCPQRGCDSRMRINPFIVGPPRRRWRWAT
jgi:WD40 repeat protein